MLQKLLFKENQTRLGYENFREVLLLLLTGRLDEKGTKIDLDTGTESPLIEFDTQVAWPDFEKPDSIDQGSLNSENIGFDKSGFKASVLEPDDTGLNCPANSYQHKDWTVPIPDMSREVSAGNDEAQQLFDFNSSSEMSPMKIYGRKSLPDLDLLQNTK